MIIRGKRARVVGNVCMDQMMVDVSGIDGVQEGDLVTLAGKDGDEEITFSELASLAGTIHYELLCLVGETGSENVPERRKSGQDSGL